MVRVQRCLVAFALLVGCLHALPVTSADRQAIQAVRDAWRAAGLPAGDCPIEVRRWTSHDGYVDECTGVRADVFRAAVSASAGCTTTESRGLFGERTYVIEIAPGYGDDEALVQHEAIHAMAACSGIASPFDPFDAGHSHARLWAAAGGVASVQAMAAVSR